MKNSENAYAYMDGDDIDPNGRIAMPVTVLTSEKKREKKK